MTAQRQRLEDLRDQVLRDIVELDRQVDAGEIPDVAANRLRVDYETSAAEILDALESVDASAEQGGSSRPRPAIVRRMVYLAASLAVVLAVGAFLPQFVADRPENGFVSGNEVTQSQPAPGPRIRPELSTVTDAEMEAVIARNPQIVGMRLVLAERYLEKRRYDKAAEHYGVALVQQPGNPKVLAESGRLLLAQGNRDAAAEFAARAQSIAPSSLDARILQAEILAERDPSGARDIVQQVVRHTDLDPDVRRHGENLLRRLEKQPGVGGR